MPDRPNLRQEAPDPGDDFLWQHLKGLPAFRALLRAVEARFYQDLLPLAEPVLDVGCGDGHFASVAFPEPLAAGIDPESAVLREARDRGAYRLLAQGLGDRLPYANGHFATVVSNSVLEHIPGVDDVVAEIARVLQPGGRFIFCVPGDRFTELLLFTQLFRRLRLEALAAAYERYFDRISRHHHCDGPDVWRKRLEAAGLQLDSSFYYFSARATHALDLGHYFGAPSLVAKKLFGRWILAPSRWNLALTERWLRPLYEEPLPEIGAYLFFVAQRP
ncbi:MAG: methyltransferase domain-containing protein [Anaerolineae bacterium]|nr:methyltransferase domain-containing protein [Anaerolineae bacterium]